jgi:hypothetical protein
MTFNKYVAQKMTAITIPPSRIEYKWSHLLMAVVLLQLFLALTSSLAHASGPYNYCFHPAISPDDPKARRYIFSFRGSDKSSKRHIGPFALTIWRQYCELPDPAGSSRPSWTGNALFFRITPASGHVIQTEQYFRIVQKGNVYYAFTNIRPPYMNDEYRTAFEASFYIAGLKNEAPRFEINKEFEINVVDEKKSQNSMGHAPFKVPSATLLEKIRG